MTTGDYVCPTDGCDSREFQQNVTQNETVSVDENGEPLQFDVDTMEVHYIECSECGTEIPV